MQTERITDRITDRIEDALTPMVKAMVTHDDAVRITSRVGEPATVVEVHVDGRDVPRLLGPRGQTAQALRQILKAVSEREGRCYVLDIVDPGEEPVEISTDPWEDDDEYEEMPTLRLAIG